MSETSSPVASVDGMAQAGPGSTAPNPAMAQAQAPEVASTPSIYDNIGGQNIQSAPTEAPAADPVAAQSSRPDYLLEKYGTPEDQAKAYPELLKKFGEFKGAPEAYDLNKLPPSVDKNSPLLKGLAEHFKGLNLSEDGFNKTVAVFAELTEKYSSSSREQIMQDLGPTGNEVIGRVGNWIKNFSPEEQTLFNEMSLSAKHIQLLDKLRASTHLSRAPTNADIMSSSGFETLKAVEAEKAQNWDRYRNDPAYASEISRRYQDAAMREGYAQESFAEMKRR